MAHLLFRLRHVTDEEAAEVRALLDEHGFDVYETQAGFFRLGVDAIWLRHADQREAAEAVLKRYQAERFTRARSELDAARTRGEAPTLWQRLSERPVSVLLTFVGVILVAALTLIPFLALMMR